MRLDFWFKRETATPFMVFLGAILYVVGYVLADIAYTVADPRVRLA